MSGLTDVLEAIKSAGGRSAAEIGLLPFLALLCVSALASVFISFLYLRFYSSRATGSQVQRSFPLLALSVTSIFICIQYSLPLSLGLLGALSIVRFRTPVKEAEEIGFIMLVIASSLAAATFNLHFLVGLLLAALVVLAVRRLAPGLAQAGARDGSIVVAMEAARYGEVGERLLERVGRLRQATLESVSRGDGRVVVAFTFERAVPADLVALDRDLAASFLPLEVSILYNRPGVI